ncbi:hypothetical protein QBC35DRAFT_500972 [Podospora australis]|uniref:PHD-type domain-containing protein n=1 Tax=Podospora australis TaxID=1536484 RepID=A0AAN7AH92_9PEZI|nr:hypothetical protein QBC35DRAFT_500972 [Podospora australis]
MAAIDAGRPAGDGDVAISPSNPVASSPSIEQAIQNTGAMNNTPLNAHPHPHPHPHSLDLRADPDAQATVSDFLDFTEYLPADMMRSLTLIGQLDQTYVDASTKIHGLTTKWGQLPNLPAAERTGPVELRAQVSENLGHALNSRIYAHAEAVRMAENVNRHLNRANTILTKLQTIKANYPPPEEQKSPVQTRSPQMSRAPKITVRIDGQKVRRPRVPRITVPGEVLAPYDLNIDAYTTGSDSSSEEEEEGDDLSSSRITPGPQRIKVVKGSSARTPKPGRMPRSRTSVPPPTFGLSTSAAMAQLAPPPENAVPGSADAPWCQLTAFELARLRKRMKKNAAWTPSDTMVARELSALGRGVDAFKAAKKKAEEEGRVFEGQMPAATVDPETGEKRLPLGALTMDALTSDDKNISTNRGMKLNEAKKLKREMLAKLAAEEAEESAKRFDEMARAIMGVNQPAPSDPSSKAVKAKAPKKRKRDSVPSAEAERPEMGDEQAQRPQFKRTKTETPVPPPLLSSANSLAPPQESSVQLPSRSSVGSAVLQSTTPIPLPTHTHDQSIPAKSASIISATSPASAIATPSSVPALAPIKLPTTETPIPPPVISPKKSSTPILPPVRETRKTQVTRAQEQQHKDVQLAPAAASTSFSRTASPELTPKPDPDASLVSTTSSTTVTRRPASRGKATSQEPQPSLAADRPRRTSTARNTPAPPESIVAAPGGLSATTAHSSAGAGVSSTVSSAAASARPTGKRAGKRPAPGIISRTNSGGNSAVGTRKAAPRKKTAAVNTRAAAGGSGAAHKRNAGDGKEAAATDGTLLGGAGGVGTTEVEVDDDGNAIDPDEPRYCLCNRVSFGTMIQCDNVDHCEKEWFHLECVGLSDIPARTTKWYCPDCRKALNIGERGEVSARGVRA